MSISAEQNAAAASEFVERVEKQFGGSGVTVSVENHSNAAKYAFVRLTCPPQHWIALAKWMRFDAGVNTFFKLKCIVPSTSKCAFCVLRATILKEIGVFHTSNNPVYPLKWIIFDPVVRL